MMCDPNQSQFMQVILKETDTTQDITYATSLRYRMMHDYMVSFNIENKGFCKNWLPFTTSSKILQEVWFNIWVLFRA